jgi:aminopeptidase N
MLTTFDLTFHCPEQLHLVSTGEPVSETVSGGIRTVHRKTQIPEALAGFNLGDYDISSFDHGSYHIDLYIERSAEHVFDSNLAKETEDVLDQYSQNWSGLPVHSLAVSPIDGYFGQGFPGLIYLSNISYIRPQDRPAGLHDSRMNLFFSDLLLPHEVAHQWWGNIVRQSDYRAGWLTEAMANDSALQYIGRFKGKFVVDAMLDSYRKDLITPMNGKPLESAGPIDFGQRLIEAANFTVWHVITYEKGSWILRMLRERLGNDGFRSLQLRMLHDFATKPISNEDFRELASTFVPAGQPDRSLALFFDTWIYSTGIPKLKLHRTGRTYNLDVSAVDDDFSADVPLRCSSIGGKEQTEWVRAVTGTNVVVPSTKGATCSLPAVDDFLYQP